MNDFQDFSYALDGKKLCCIINNKSFKSSLNLSERRGTNKDCKDLKKLFEKLNFKVNTHKNRSSKQIHDILRKISQWKNLDQYCMFICIILSHGEEGIIYGTDEIVNLDELIGYFKGDFCKKLVGKPKLFFIQACRGDKYDAGEWADALSSNNISKIPIEPDFLIGYSTVPGYFSWRNNFVGSWYIQALCHEIKNNYKTSDIIDILVRVNNNVAKKTSDTGIEKSHGKLQIPSFSCMLRKQLWFVLDHQ